ncbi:MAG TPA: hypothetical protein VGF59_02880, partial [Bryobacteraceae bacterium]
MPISKRLRIILFLALTYALSSIFYVQIAAAGKMKMLPVFGLMWCLGTAAILIRLLTQRNLRGTGWSWGATRWQAVGYLLAPLLGLAVYGVVWLTGIGGFDPEGLVKEFGNRAPLGSAL